MNSSSPHEDDDPQKCLLLAGPTASGKSAIAIRIAQAFDGVIINADSMQVYEGIREISAAPSEDEEAQAPHRLYGVLSPDIVCNSAMWRDMALKEIRAAHAAGKLPILVGGTGLYFEVLVNGIAEIPDPPPEVRTAVRAEIEKIGNDAFHAKYLARDPVVFGRLFPGDTQRMLRAAEVLEATGRSLDAWIRTTPTGPKLNTSPLWFALTPPREWVYARCDLRFEKMVREGRALEEVEGLLAQNLSPDRPAMKALGVPELTAYLRGKLSLEQAIEKAQTGTRRYAKRQMTWIRGQMSDARKVVAQDLESFERENFAFIRQFWLTRKS